MKSVNRLTLKGILASNPLIRMTSENKPFAHIRIKTSTLIKGQEEERSKATYHNILVFAPNFVEKLSQGYGEGDIIFLEGFLQNRKEMDAIGQTRYIPQIIVNEAGKLEVFSKIDQHAKKKSGKSSALRLHDEELAHA